MNKKLLIALSLFLFITTAYAQKQAPPTDTAALWTSAKANMDSKNWITPGGCDSCKDITLTGRVTEIIGTKESNKRDRKDKTDCTDCDYTFNIILDDSSRKKLHWIAHKYYTGTIKHIDTLHIEAICANWEKNCPCCQGIDISVYKDILYNLKVNANEWVEVRGRLIVDTGNHKANNSFQPQFEIHPVYSITHIK
jgi:hypothetical protein